MYKAGHTITGKISKVEIGGGMGSTFAGALADWVLFLVAEKSFLARYEHALALYARFRDDIVMCAPSVPSAKKLAANLASAASEIFVLETERVSTHSVVILDLEVYWRAPGLLGYRPLVNKTARHVPLSSCSYHPPAVHRAWPIAEMRRLHRCALFWTDSVAFRRRKVARFAECFLNPLVLARCRSWLPDSTDRVTLQQEGGGGDDNCKTCHLYTSPSPRDATLSRMPSSA